MSVSVRQQIVQAAQAALNTAATIPAGLQSKPANFTAMRERMYPIEKSKLPAAILYSEDDVPRHIGGESGYSIERSVALAVEARAWGSPSDLALDPVIVWITQRFFADETFGGLATRVIEGRTVWSIKTGDDPIAAATIHFSIKYRTSRTDPTVKP